MRRLRRLAKRLGIILLELFILVTLASVVYNTATAGRVKPATALYPGPFVRLDGKLVAYRRWGNRGSPIILLGGFVEPNFVWKTVGARLGRTHRVFAIDLPPFGYSERNGPYTLREWASLVRGFAGHFGLRRPIVVGHSLGAAVAVGVALWDQVDTRGIVLLDGDALSAGGPGRWVSDLLVGPWFTSVYRIATGSNWIVRSALREAAGPSHPPFTHEFLDEWKRPFEVRGTLDAYRSMLQYGIQGFHLPDLRRVRVRALVLWGQHDTVDPVSAGRDSAEALRAPFRLLAGAGHLSMIGAPTELARAIDAFAGV
jgi:pimeloyl-ACP methyl ester carboxylesterase